MTITKIRVDLGQGIVEAEGSEEFVRSVYEDFKGRLRLSNAPISTEPPKQPVKKVAKIPAQGVGKKRKGGPSRSSPSLITNLNLRGTENVESLRDFYAKYKPTSNFQRNINFLYYLTEKLGITGITVDHIFTCYRDIPRLKAPNAYQSLIDTSRSHGWIDTSSTDDIKVTIKGINYLEHDMPRPKPESK